MSRKMPEIDLADAEKVKQTKIVQKKIQKLYRDTAKKLAKEASKLPADGLISQQMRKMYLEQHIEQLEKEIDAIEASLYKEVQLRMELTAKAVVDANISFMGRCGINIQGGFSYVPKEVVKNLIQGKVYANDWNFSKALWQSSKRIKKDIHTIVAEGLTAQRPTYDIAKDLEKYLNPSAKKPWDWSKVYPGTTKKVDYNAQRLARTLIQHSYQQAYRQTIKNNPFVEGVIWHSVFAAGRTCALCQERDGQRYEKGKEPLDHPQGLCYLEPDIPMSMTSIADELADWAHGKSNPQLDAYMESLYKGNVQAKSRAKESAKTATAKSFKGKKKNPDEVYAPR